MLIVPYMIPSYLFIPADIKKWWIWGYWISPISYAQNAISTNEFLGPSWNEVSTLSLDKKSNLPLRTHRKFNIYSHYTDCSWTKRDPWSYRA